MQKFSWPIVVPDPTSNEIQAWQQPAFEMEGHGERLITGTVGPLVLLAGNADTCLVGNVAGQLQVI